MDEDPQKFVPEFYDIETLDSHDKKLHMMRQLTDPNMPDKEEDKGRKVSVKAAGEDKSQGDNATSMG